MGKKKKQLEVDDVDMTSFDIDSQRTTHESSTEWRLRRAFLEAHHDKFPPERLICLSQCFINVQLYGCLYPPALMRELTVLTNDLNECVSEFRARIQERTAVKFVKASSDSVSDTSTAATSSATSSTSVATASASASTDSTQSTSSVDAAHSGPAPAKKKKPSDSSNKFLKPLSFVKADSGNLGSSTQETAHNSTDDVTSSAPASVRPSQTTSSQNTSRNLASKASSTKDMLRQAKAASSAAAAATTGAVSGKLLKLRELASVLQGKQQGRSGGGGGNAVMLLNEACQKTHASFDVLSRSTADGAHVAELFLDGVFIAQASAAKKKNAKLNACELATQKLTGAAGALDVVQANGREELVCRPGGGGGGGGRPAVGRLPPPNSALNVAQLTMTSQQGMTSQLPLTTKASKRRGRRQQPQEQEESENAPCTSIDQFVLIEHFTSSLNSNPVSLLHSSADFNHTTVTYESTSVQGRKHTAVYLAGQQVVQTTSTEGAGAGAVKLNAAAMALQALRARCWTILVKQVVDGDSDQLSKEEVISDGHSYDVTTDRTPIPETNIGNKLLKLMGWTGGGVGAEGNKGRAEPVAVSGVVDRGGLGLSGSGGVARDFKAKILPVIQHFLSSEREDDLAFTPDFTKEERHVIHQQAQRMGLRTRSYGKDAERFLVISRRRSARQLLAYVQQEGGETAKYKLLPPGQHPALQGKDGDQWLDVHADDGDEGDDVDDDELMESYTTAAAVHDVDDELMGSYTTAAAVHDVDDELMGSYTTAAAVHDVDDELMESYTTADAVHDVDDELMGSYTTADAVHDVDDGTM